MSNSVIRFKKNPVREDAMNNVKRLECSQPTYEIHILATRQIASRIYYPFHVSSMEERGFCPHSSPHAFDALYQNALGFLEKVQAEETFQ